MGTRSLTIIKTGDTEIAVLYRQYDGYPSGHGADLKGILAGRPVVNGISDARQINGGHDMAVQIISALKGDETTPGGLYLYPAGTRNMGEEFTYTVTAPEVSWWSGIKKTAKIHLKVEGYGVSYDGPLDDFDPRDPGGDEDAEDAEGDVE